MRVLGTYRPIKQLKIFMGNVTSNKMRGRQLLIVLFTVVLIKFLMDTGEFLALPDVESAVDDVKRATADGNFAVKQITKEDENEDAYTRNLNRILTVKKSCVNLGLPSEQNTTQIRAHVSPDKNVLYCRINKCASTMTLELMRKLFDCDTDCLIGNARLIKEDPVNGVGLMRRAFSFIVVREPYTRIFSTYSNIFYFPKEDWSYRSTTIIQKVRDQPSADSLKYGHDLTFAELVKYTVEGYEKGIRIDEHVRPMSHRSCDPCAFNFDFIVKLETIKSDLEYLLSTWKTQGLIGNYDLELLNELREWTVYGPIKHLFRVIPTINSTNISIYTLFLRAWSYYQITGQVSKYINFPFEERQVRIITAENFRSALEKAREMSRNANHDLKAQRIEALREAYATVPQEYIDRLEKVVRSDCMLFGYDLKPDFLKHLKSSNTNSGDIHYFKGLKP